MSKIWRRVFYPALAILVMGVVAFIGFGISVNDNLISPLATI